MRRRTRLGALDLALELARPRVISLDLARPPAISRDLALELLGLAQLDQRWVGGEG